MREIENGEYSVVIFPNIWCPESKKEVGSNCIQTSCRVDLSEDNPFFTLLRQILTYILQGWSLAVALESRGQTS